MADEAGQDRHPPLDGVLSLFSAALTEGRGEEDRSTVDPVAPEAGTRADRRCRRPACTVPVWPSGT
ncbi:hypothetical protein ACIRU3_05125 [Streptomyces sp. NPDC101151]|uniref:hypothetical protein n=1 Tax=Streptomyces sp. NPDC101151 TaxID=3366115 RepID=UPI00381B0C59